jgi:hypothetical protein
MLKIAKASMNDRQKTEHITITAKWMNAQPSSPATPNPIEVQSRGIIPFFRFTSSLPTPEP